MMMQVKYALSLFCSLFILLTACSTQTETTLITPTSDSVLSPTQLQDSFVECNGYTGHLDGIEEYNTYVLEQLFIRLSELAAPIEDMDAIAQEFVAEYNPVNATDTNLQFSLELYSNGEGAFLASIWSLYCPISPHSSRFPSLYLFHPDGYQEIIHSMLAINTVDWDTDRWIVLWIERPSGVYNPTMDTHRLIHIVEETDSWQIQEFPDIFQPRATEGRLILQDGYEQIILVQCPVNGMPGLAPEAYYYQWNNSDYDLIEQVDGEISEFCDDD